MTVIMYNDVTLSCIIMSDIYYIYTMKTSNANMMQWVMLFVTF